MRDDAAGSGTWTKRWLVAAAAVACAQCASWNGGETNSGSPPPEVAQDAVPAPGSASSAEAPDFWRDVKPVLDTRCVNCHACFDAPCQLNLASYEGIERGASRDKVYMSSRLRDAPPTRLGIDARSAAEWRGKGFHSVLGEDATRAGSAQPDGAGLMLGLLALKRRETPPAAMPLGAEYTLDTERKWQCPAPEEFDRFARRHPRWGMPYGLPALEPGEFATLTNWLVRGAPYREPPAPGPGYGERIARWESFLNGSSPKQRVMSRYLYEHLFLASLYFEDLDHRQYFRLVRSSSPPGEPIREIATRMPFGDPGTAAFWYRLRPVTATVVAKSHLPYRLDGARMARYRQLFLDPAYEIAELPTYAPEVASNPFIAFRDLPVESRYRFMLDDAEFFIRGFMQGPVCRGQVAVDVIEDRFWVVFVTPDTDLSMRSTMLLAREGATLRLPAEGVSGPLGLVSWQGYKKSQMAYLMAKQKFLDETTADIRADLNLIWDGDGHDSDAGLTIFRHFDNASVVRGLVGSPPKTAWIIGYSLFERIHYLLVAGFDVYGNAGHQLSTRLYMDFLRMEGEFNFIALLPIARRQQVRDYWYRDAAESVREYVYGSEIAFSRDSDIRYLTDDPRTELMQMFRARLDPVLELRHELASEPDEFRRGEMERLAGIRGESLALLPEASLLAIVDGPAVEIEATAVYTLIRDTAHLNVASLFREEKRLIPAENELTVARGIAVAYPNALFRVERSQLSQFVDAVASLAAEPDYRALVARFGVERTSDGFWSHSDELARAFSALDPLRAGVLDYGRLENR